MKFHRLLIIALAACFLVSWFPKAAFWKSKGDSTGLKSGTASKVSSLKKLEQKAAAAKKFTAQKKMNEGVAFFIEMGLASGSNRFFMYDLKKDSLISKGLVAHGNCFEYWMEGRRYSNVVGSGCTSLGKYKIGANYVGKWGYSYKLHGLDSTNNKAFERTVVLHGHSCVPDAETTDEICQSNGCPTVAPAFLEQLKTIINNSRKPVLLWIYE